MNMKRVYLLLLLMLHIAYLSAQDMIDKQGKKVNVNLDEVVVTGTGTQHLLKNVPVQTEVITSKVLQNYAGKSLEDILAGLTASFDFNEGDMGSQMQMNGLGNNYILILVDGKRIHGDVGGENDLGLIDPQNIEKIEIVKGAASALYGSDAIAGVINIITKKNDQDGLTLDNTTRYGAHNDLRQHNGIAVKYGKWQSYTNFQLQHNDGWQNTGDEYTEGTLVHDSRNKTVNKYTNWQIAERIDYTPSNKLGLYAEGTYYHKIINRPTNGLYPSCDVYTYDLMYKNASASIGGKYRLNNSDYITMDIDWNKHAYFYQYTANTLEDGYDPNGNFTNYFPYLPGQHHLQSDQQRTMASLKGVFFLPFENTLSAGAEFRYDYLNAPTRVKGKTADDWTAALYIQDEFNLLSWFNLTAGVRFNQNAAFGFRATPKISAMFSMGDFRLRLGWSEGFKTPTPKELQYQYLRQMGQNTYFYMGNPNLKPQVSNYSSASIEYRGNKITASVTGYYNKLDNMITLVNVPVSMIPIGSTEFLGDGSTTIIPRMYMNMEKAKTYGVDLNLTYNINKEITLGANYSYLDTDAEVYDDSHDKLKKVVIDGMAHHKWNAYATYNHKFTSTYKLGLGLYARGSSMRYYQNDGNGKAYQILRFNTTHDFTGKGKLTYRIEAGMDNILDFVDRTPRHNHLGSTTPGRTLYASFTIKFSQGKKLKNNIIHKTNNNSNEED